MFFQNFLQRFGSIHGPQSLTVPNDKLLFFVFRKIAEHQIGIAPTVLQNHQFLLLSKTQGSVETWFPPLGALLMADHIFVLYRGMVCADEEVSHPEVSLNGEITSVHWSFC